ncbi:MAG TPA: T9SS type A sorting domain-containing protein, partial [Candidatus Cloacimonetes bacterium]|nr:T9SS type A sorting domain-containing protein [Candidatus Cloacimonadota bacterium]
YKDVAENFDQPPVSPKPAFAVNSIFAHPNPFNPVTTITYSIKNPSQVKLSIYSITGQKVTTLIDNPMSAGSHSVVFDGSDFGSGVYIYNLNQWHENSV